VVLGPDGGLKQPCAVNFHDVITVTKKDIRRRVAQLDDDRMREVCRALAFALGCGD
jgi:mRNA-degrading endonuclease toxin of MazEF toxin-antitoxin module